MMHMHKAAKASLNRESLLFQRIFIYRQQEDDMKLLLTSRLECVKLLLTDRLECVMSFLVVPLTDMCSSVVSSSSLSITAVTARLHPRHR